jgi:hypothetical protein
VETLLSIEQWAREWNLSERRCQQLRKHPLYPPDTEVRLSAQSVRFRGSRLALFAASLAAQTQPVGQPEKLRLGRERKAAERRLAESAA